MRLLITIESIGITDLEVDWEGEIPMPGDKIEILYYLECKKYKEYYSQIIREAPYLSEIEREFLGRSMGELLHTYIPVVQNRIWIGKEHGCMLSCELEGNRRRKGLNSLNSTDNINPN